jgi:hypothetical protein
LSGENKHITKAYLPVEEDRVLSNGFDVVGMVYVNMLPSASFY